MKKVITIFQILAIVFSFVGCEKTSPSEIKELNLPKCLSPSSLGTSIENDYDVLFSWIPTKEVEKYNLVVSTDEEFTQILCNVSVPVSEVPYKITLEPGQYYYKVQGTHPDREPSLWSICKKPVVVEKAWFNINLSEQETANCYVIEDKGHYRFKPTKGCTNTAIEGISSVEIIWEAGTDDESTVLEANSIISSPALNKDGYITFDSASPYTPGNALIAAKNASGTILWSWHIWAVESKIKDVDWGNSMILMDRNIGETQVANALPRTSMLYQWGRKDPFPGTNGTSSLVNVSGTRMSHIAQTANQATTTANPTVLYGALSTTGANVPFMTESIDSWGDFETNSKTEWDPCPAGYKVPHALAATARPGWREFTNDLSKCRFAAMKGLTFSNSIFALDLGNGNTATFGNSGYVLLNTTKDVASEVSPTVLSEGNGFFLWTASWAGTVMKRMVACVRVTESTGAQFWSAYDTGDASVKYHSKNNAYPVRCERISK